LIVSLKLLRANFSLFVVVVEPNFRYSVGVVDVALPGNLKKELNVWLSSQVSHLVGVSFEHVSGE
jgi:hypothetical protein